MDWKLLKENIEGAAEEILTTTPALREKGRLE
jgi:hypothetical protein